MKLDEDPEAVGPEDIRPLREAGLTDDEIEDVIAVSSAFHAIIRVADALGFALHEGEAARSADALLGRGYL